MISRVLRPLVLVGLTLVMGSGPSARVPAAARDLEVRLRQAVAAGRLDPARADLYRAYAVRAAAKLPAAFRSDGFPGGPELARGEIPEHRCGTPALHALRARLSSLPPELAAEARALLDPPRANRGLERTAGRSVSHDLPNWITTEHFSVEWGSAITNPDGTTPAVDSDSDGVPDVVRQWASYFEESYRQEVVEQGFARSDLDRYYIQVFIGNSQPGNPIDDIEGRTYGYTQDTAGAPPYVVVANNLSFVPHNDDPVDDDIHGAMKVTAAHEYFHVVQFVTPGSGTWGQEYNWWLEASSTWMEDEVFNQVNDYRYYVQSWVEDPEEGIVVDSFDSRAYGDVIFAKYLSEHTGGRAAMRQVWELIEPSRSLRPLDALEEYARDAGFDGLEDLYLGFSAANARMDYREGVAYGTVPVRKASLIADSSGVPSLPLPEYLGSTYLRGTGSGGPVRLTVNGTPAETWGVAVSVPKLDGSHVVLGNLGPAGSTSVAIAELPAGQPTFASISYLEKPQDTQPPAGGGGGGGGGGGCFLRSLAFVGRAEAAVAGSGATRYATALEQISAADAVAPGSPALQGADGRPGGFDLGWNAGSDDVAVAGYVVRWRPAGGSWAHQTLWGPVLAIEVRGTQPDAAYEVEVSSYDTSGNVSTPSAGVVTSGPAPSLTVPEAPITGRSP